MGAYLPFLRRHSVGQDFIPIEPPPEPMVRPKKTVNPLLVTLLIAVILALFIVPAARRPQSLEGRAASPKCMPIAKVMIHPGEVVTHVDTSHTALSVLAYDYTDMPITRGVIYDWGISSTVGIGTLKPKHDLADFIPSRIGMGDLYVKATSACTRTPIIGSVKVYVQAALMPTPTLSNRKRIK